MNSNTLQKSLVFSYLLVLFAQTIRAQVTAVPVCETTGHRCITTDQCASLSLTDGQYQWCGGCQNQVRCQAGVGQLFTYNFHPFTQWDDNKKNYELISTTCAECYYPCPTGPSAPTNPSGPLCDKTGFGCLMDSCPSGASGSFQYCGNCSHYVTCGLTAGYNLVACASGTFFDDFSRTCETTSNTCRECYDTCIAPTTAPTFPDDERTEPNEPSTTTQGSASSLTSLTLLYIPSILGAIRALRY